MATRLGVYNEALRLCGSRQLANLSENREPRRLLDAAWDANAHDSWLEQADWNFAIRATKIGADPSFTKQWGYTNAFNHPEDMVRPAGIYADEYMEVPLREYLDEGKFWFTEAFDIIYVQYVSNLSTAGGDLGLWPASFAKYVAAFLAVEIAPNIKNDVDTGTLMKILERRERDAKAKDGLRQPSKDLPMGSWKRSRLSGRRGDGRSGNANVF
jgi:hypothetical protein